MAKSNPENNAKRKKVKSKQTNPLVVYLLITLLAVGLILMLLFHGKVEDGLGSAINNAIEQMRPTSEVEPPEESQEPIQRDPEDASQVEDFVDLGFYENSRVLTYQAADTITLSIGMESDYDGGLILNPVLYYDLAANLDEPYGFLVRTDKGTVQTCGIPADINDPQNSGKQFFCIAERTYDKLTPASFQDEDWFGIRWVNNSIYGDPSAGAELTIHAIRLQDGFLMAAAKVKIEYDPTRNSYRFADIHGADVLETGELDAETREDTIMKAISFINEGTTTFTGEISRENYLNYQQFVVVERLNRVLFNRLFDASGVACPAGRFLQCDIYAVNIPYTGRGYMTIYFAPSLQALTYSRDTNLVIEDESSLSVIGYDPLAPFSVEEFNSFLLPEDAEYFGVN